MRGIATLKKYRYTVLMVVLCGLLVIAQPARSAPADAAARARSILQSTGIQGGVILHLGSGDGRLTAALHGGDAYVVRGLDADPKDVKKARRYIRSRGLYGEVSIGHLRGESLPFTDNLVNLVVADETTTVPTSEMIRVLAPGGVAYIQEDGDWISRKKPRPEEIDEWTHFLHDASNNAVAEDSRIDPPEQLQWKSRPVWSRSHEFPSSVNSLVSASGRVFGIIDRGLAGQPRGVPAEWTLVARDAFNGTLLWDRPTSKTGRRSLVAGDDRVYIILDKGGPVHILDAATGKTKTRCEGTDKAKELIYSAGRVICRARNSKKQRRSGGKAEAIVAADGKTGEMLWKRAEENIASRSLAAENGRVCYHTGDKLVAVDVETGDELWSVSSGKGKYVLMHKDVVFVSGGGTTAYSASSGEKLWSNGVGARAVPGIFVADGLVWSSWPSGTPYPHLDASVKGNRTILWDPRKSTRKGRVPRTGEVKRKVTAERLVTPGHHIRCYPPKATERYLLLNKRGVEFLDLRGDNHMRQDWLRAPCYYGFMPANGLTYMPPHQCFCYPGVVMTGLNALTSRTSPETGSSDEHRLVSGPADAEDVGPEKKPSNQEWPTYRHDPRRSGSVDWRVPSRPKRVWKTKLGGKLSPPVAAGGRLFVANINSHAVRCLDADTGEVVWTYSAGARVDSPPTIHRGLVLFGSADGNIYCLRASDGKLAWRFRAAPAKKWISVRGQLESAWPSHGSVLVRDGLVYATAGHSSHLNGGIRIYALDPETGEVMHRQKLETPRPDVSNKAGRPFDMEGARSDILVSGEQHIYLYHNRFNKNLSREPMRRVTKLGDRKGGLHLMSTGGFLTRHWADGAFNRVFWMYSSRWPGYYFGYKAPRTGQLIVFDENTTYSAKYYTERHGHSPEFRPGSGYKLVADSNENDPVLRTARWGQEKGGGFSREQFWKWSSEVPVRIEAMVLAGDRLYIAGPPDLEPGKQAQAAMRGLKGARFRVVSASDGEKLAARKLQKAPVFDGLIAAYGQLYMATQDGTLICLGVDDEN